MTASIPLFDVSTEGDITTFQIPWNRSKAKLGRFLIGFFAFLIIMMLLSGAPIQEMWGLILFMLLLMTIFWYFTRLRAKNFTYVEVTPKHLRCYHGPVFYPGNRIFPLEDIQELTVRHRTEKTDPTDTTSPWKQNFYDVYIMPKGGGKLRIVSNVSHFAMEAMAQQLANALWPVILEARNEN
ncbi:MAG TPA: hypothetical protein DCR93_38375 [Cytophagales bacterium]|nr:hypothetical protein [Cytophagales bacterium]HAP65104.1 hypothetical protein [Cytophagales bacterium]